MEKLYLFLLKHSLKGQKHPFEVKVPATARDRFGEDLHSLSNSLVQGLHSRFELFFSALRVVSESEPGEDPESHSHLWAVVEELVWFLRCCLVILTLLQSDQKSLLEKCRYILQMLKLFVSFDLNETNGRILMRFDKFVSGECAYTHDAFTKSAALELSGICRPFLCAVLEVFADELLKHPSVGKILMIVDSVSSISEKHFMCHSNCGGIASVLEVISAHFSLSIFDEKSFENFISRLVWHCGKDSIVPRLSPAPPIILLLNPVVLSAPKLFQAHVISLVSEAIGDNLSSEILDLDRRMDCCLTAFEASIILYSVHVSSLQMDGFHTELNCAHISYLLGKSQPTFESCIKQATRSKLDNFLLKSDNSCDSYLSKMPSKAEASLLAEYSAFMKERQHTFTDSCRDMILSILDCIIHGTFGGDASADLLYKLKNTSARDVCLLASILKLMSISLIQAIDCLSKSDDSGYLKTLKNSSLRKRYDFLISIINCFQQFNTCLPIQTCLSDVMKSHQKGHKDSMWMLMYFSSLLSVSFISGLGLLAKACISVIMALVYLFVFEEGDFVALESFRDLNFQSSSSEIASDKPGEMKSSALLQGDGVRRSSYKIASEFNKSRTHQLRFSHPLSFHQGINNELAENLKNMPFLDYVATYDYIEEETEETCSGEIFLDCVLEGSQRSSDYADLVDFIECKKGKDYSSWLKARKIYRGRRYERIATLRKKIRKTQSKLKCQKTSVARETVMEKLCL